MLRSLIVLTIASPKTSRVSESFARQQLKEILAAPEFSETVHGPSAWERLKQQMLHWLGAQFEGLFKALARHPTTTEIVFWGAALGALGVIAFLLFQLFRRREKVRSHQSAADATPGQSWNEWLKGARTASERGDLNKAIQCVYWAAVDWLQNGGTLPKTAGLTPRELLQTGKSVELRALTAALERFWYGRMPASMDDYMTCLRSVEALGCKVD